MDKSSCCYFGISTKGSYFVSWRHHLLFWPCQIYSMEARGIKLLHGKQAKTRKGNLNLSLTRWSGQAVRKPLLHLNSLLHHEIKKWIVLEKEKRQENTENDFITCQVLKKKINACMKAKLWELALDLIYIQEKNQRWLAYLWFLPVYHALSYHFTTYFSYP